MPNRIIAAAIKHRNVVFTGVRHGHIIKQLVDLNLITEEERPIKSYQQGFIDTGGNYWNREDAWDIALAAKQITKDHSTLYSEDLWQGYNKIMIEDYQIIAELDNEEKVSDKVKSFARMGYVLLGDLKVCTATIRASDSSVDAIVYVQAMVKYEDGKLNKFERTVLPEPNDTTVY